MIKKSVGSKDAADKLVKNIRRRTSRKYSAEEKIRIVLAGLRGEESILVVIGHTVLGLGPSLVIVADYGNALTEMIYLFHMPLFFALSGVVFVKLDTRLNWQNWISRILKLTWSMVLWTYVFLIAKLVGGKANNDPISSEALFKLPIPGILHF